MFNPGFCFHRDGQFGIPLAQAHAAHSCDRMAAEDAAAEAEAEAEAGAEAEAEAETEGAAARLEFCSSACKKSMTPSPNASVRGDTTCASMHAREEQQQQQQKQDCSARQSLGETAS